MKNRPRIGTVWRRGQRVCRVESVYQMRSTPNITVVRSRVLADDGIPYTRKPRLTQTFPPGSDWIEQVDGTV